MGRDDDDLPAWLICLACHQQFHIPSDKLTEHSIPCPACGHTVPLHRSDEYRTEPPEV